MLKESSDPNGQNWNEPIKINWIVMSYVVFTPILALIGIPWYVWNNGIHWMDVTLLVVLYLFSGLAITAGYHRYFTHLSYECHWTLRLFYVVFGAIAIQRDVLQWAKNHRIHHQYSDTPLDPHNVKRGFMFSHVGWFVYHTPLDGFLDNVKDLEKDPIVRFQHKYYWWLVLGVGVALPTLCGALVGRPFGGFLWGGLLRLVLQSHATYSINSFAHTFGNRKFSLNNEARNSWFLAFVSNGEGFHSFHHRFASDYRNGWLWYHWDPSKWMIKTGSWLGLTRNLKSAKPEEVWKAEWSTDLQRVKQSLASVPEEVRKSVELKLHSAKAQLEAMAVQWVQAKQEFREYRKRLAESERKHWQSQLRQYKRDFQVARANWVDLIDTLSRVTQEKLELLAQQGLQLERSLH